MTGNSSVAPVEAFVALGSNLRDPRAEVLSGFAALNGLPGTRLLASSSLYASAPMGYADQPDFVNAVAKIETTLGPRQLLEALLAIERQRGRQRDIPNGPRTLDLDLLLYGGLEQQEPGLSIPHPRMHERAFVLLPLVEIGPEVSIPGRGRAADWLAKCADQTINKMIDQ
jgi:2-amino-4-hydroxy-6-hydroxymethyldihydropteridine diphosphokinase